MAGLAAGAYCGLRMPVRMAWRSGLAIATVTWLILGSVTNQLGAFTNAVLLPVSWLCEAGAIMLAIGIARVLAGAGPMARAIGAFAAAGIAVSALAIVYSSVNGYTVWYLAIPTARVTVDGERNSGYVHMNAAACRTLYVTRRGFWSAESYRVYVPGERPAFIERSFPIPRFPVFAEGDIQRRDPFAHDQPHERNPKSGPAFVEFTADDGRRVRAEW